MIIFGRPLALHAAEQESATRDEYTLRDTCALRRAGINTGDALGARNSAERSSRYLHAGAPGPLALHTA